MSRKFNQLFHESGSWKKQTVFPAVEINPDLAAEFLRLNGKNRPVRNRFTKQYTEDMKKGKWQFNGDVIRISTSGLILDGQHRLLAIVDSGTTQKFNIQTGLPDAVFDVIDIGVPRSASDTVAVAGYKNYNVLAGSAKLIMAYVNGMLKKQAQGDKGGRFSNADVLDFIEHKADIDWLQEAAGAGNKSAYRFKVFSSSTYAAFIYLFGLKDREAALLFFDMLASGENISKTSYSMIYLLRSKLINFQQSNAKLQTVDKYALLIKSWNAFRKGKEISQLAWQQKEDFPAIQ